MTSEFYRRKLPHWQPDQATFFVTFRLAGSIPKEVLNRMQSNYQQVQNGVLLRQDLNERERRELIYAEQKRFFAQTDDFLGRNPNGPYWLRDDRIARILNTEMLSHDAFWYVLWTFCIMPNHVHLLLTLQEGAPRLTKIMQHIKSYSGQKANRCLGLRGQFWERESYDHWVRSGGEFERIQYYILQNPVKAKLVDEWEQWPWTYLRT